MNTEHKRPSEIESIDIRETGAPIDGEPQFSDRRLFFQLHVLTGDLGSVIERIEAVNNFHYPDGYYHGLKTLRSIRFSAVLYDDLHHPIRMGVLFVAENPGALMQVSEIILKSGLSYYPKMAMLGRTYSSGREPNLEEWLIDKPLQNVLNPDFPWAIWYPLRRKPEFYRLDPRERGRILGEHAMLGRSYAASGHARDIRLACFGLDTNDNEFVIGLVGPELYPLSRLIQDMRQTEQTTKYIESLGPFFVGKVWKRFSLMEVGSR